MKRIKANQTPAAEAAKILKERHGRNAEQVASNRADAAQRESTAAYYEEVHLLLRETPLPPVCQDATSNRSPHSCGTEDYDPRCLRCVAGDDAQIHEIDVTRAIATYADGSETDLRYHRDDGWRFPEQGGSPGFDHAAGYHT